LLLHVRRAAAAEIECPDACASRWLEHMHNGDFERAWRVSDRLLAARRAPAPRWLPRHAQWIWDGTPLDGRRVLIRCYHGLGDTIQFIRYASRVRARASRVIVWCQERLIPVIGTVAGIDELLRLHDGSPPEIYDVDVEIMELPYIFRTTLGNVPAETPYIHAPAIERSRRDRPIVGLVWKAGDWGPHRSLSFGRLEPLFHAPVDWHILQAGPGLLERPPGFGIVTGQPDPIDTAIAMRDLDLLISVDSMPAHLAGALHVPVWTLLPANADWRWMRDRADSPWYPTMRLFRQRGPGAWGDVLRDVAAALDAFCRRWRSCA
jgi:hypothetical protein